MGAQTRNTRFQLFGIRHVNSHKRRTDGEAYERLVRELRVRARVLAECAPVLLAGRVLVPAQHRDRDAARVLNPQLE